MKNTNIPTESGKYTTTITNSCVCVIDNDEAGDWKEVPECCGVCWTDQVEHFQEITKHLFSDNEQGFTLVDFPVWNGTRDGYFLVRNAQELLRKITPYRTEWRWELTVHATHLTGRLSYHDATGVITVTPFSQDK
jgi:hypothetical protein